MTHQGQSWGLEVNYGRLDSAFVVTYTGFVVAFQCCCIGKSLAFARPTASSSWFLASGSVCRRVYIVRSEKVRFLKGKALKRQQLYYNRLSFIDRC